MHTTRGTEIVSGNMLIESVEAEFVQRGFQLKVCLLYTVHNGTFHGANRAVTNYALSEIQGCVKSYPSAVAGSLVALLHDTQRLSQLADQYLGRALPLQGP